MGPEDSVAAGARSQESTTTSATGLLATARARYEDAAWVDALTAFRAAAAEAPLSPPDLNRMATAAYLTGHDEEACATWERAHHALLAADAVPAAVRVAFWLGIVLVRRGAHAPGSGWLGRAREVLDASGLDCVERGYLVIPTALQALQGGDAAAARDGFREATAIADRFGDPDGRALGRLGHGQALVALGRTEEGVALLDQAMVEVTSADVSPLAAGLVYCAVIIACRDSFDVRRAREWTAALSRWCADQQGLSPYRGQCLVHRSEIMQLGGDWAGAMEAAEEACMHLADPPGDPVMGMARYQQAELLRLRGQFDRAEASYRQANQWGHPVHPGLALLRLAQGRVGDAAAAIQRVADQHEGDRVARARVLSAYVEIMLADGAVDAARAATEQLEQAAAEVGVPHLHALATAARGAVALEDGDHSTAAAALRRSWRWWQQLAAPYEAARVRLVMARACRGLGDDDTAEMELDAARRVFRELGAAPALAQATRASDRGEAGDAPGGLTTREVEVLRLVATGATNREVAVELVISERTVARHLSNMFTKLGLASRAAATAWAYEHELV